MPKSSNSPSQDRTATIRALNDQLRRNQLGGRIMCTAGIDALGSAAVFRILRAVAAFDAFTPDNDPHGEHDFGALDAEGHRIFWKIDLYEDPAVKQAAGGPGVQRILTIMLAEECAPG